MMLALIVEIEAQIFRFFALFLSKGTLQRIIGLRFGCRRRSPGRGSGGVFRRRGGLVDPLWGRYCRLGLRRAWSRRSQVGGGRGLRPHRIGLCCGVWRPVRGWCRRLSGLRRTGLACAAWWRRGRRLRRRRFGSHGARPRRGWRFFAQSRIGGEHMAASRTLESWTILSRKNAFVDPVTGLTTGTLDFDHRLATSPQYLPYSILDANPAALLQAPKAV